MSTMSEEDHNPGWSGEEAAARALTRNSFLRVSRMRFCMVHAGSVSVVAELLAEARFRETTTVFVGGSITSPPRPGLGERIGNPANSTQWRGIGPRSAQQVGRGRARTRPRLWPEPLV